MSLKIITIVTIIFVNQSQGRPGVNPDAGFSQCGPPYIVTLPNGLQMSLLGGCDEDGLVLPSMFFVYLFIYGTLEGAILKFGVSKKLRKCTSKSILPKYIYL